VTYVWDSTTQDTEAVHYSIGTAASEIVARICLSDMSCHGTREVGVARVGRSEVEVVHSRGICGDVLVVEVGRELNRAAYTVKLARCLAQCSNKRVVTGLPPPN